MIHKITLLFYRFIAPSVWHTTKTNMHSITANKIILTLSPPPSYWLNNPSLKIISYTVSLRLLTFRYNKHFFNLYFSHKLNILSTYSISSNFKDLIIIVHELSEI